MNMTTTGGACRRPTPAATVAREAGVGREDGGRGRATGPGVVLAMHSDRLEQSVIV
jgi:hypothetical protein